jgi:hypothetical protein
MWRVIRLLHLQWSLPLIVFHLQSSLGSGGVEEEEQRLRSNSSLGGDDVKRVLLCHRVRDGDISSHGDEESHELHGGRGRVHESHERGLTTGVEFIYLMRAIEREEEEGHVEVSSERGEMDNTGAIRRFEMRVSTRTEKELDHWRWEGQSETETERPKEREKSQCEMVREGSMP